MLFLIINSIIGKYYPKFITQFIIGCVSYSLFFLILHDFILDSTYNKYKYYALSLVIIDLSYFIYKTNFEEKITFDKPPKIQKRDDDNIISESNKIDSEMSSDSNNINGLSLTESDENSIFSPSS